MSSASKIDLMYKLFGRDEEHQCKTCKNLTSYEASRRWYKCSVYGESKSTATDWRLKMMKNDVEFTINECVRRNLCVDCDNKDCGLVGKLISDCPKYRCDREGDLFEDCKTCDFLKVYSNEMRNVYGEKS